MGQRGPSAVPPPSDPVVRGERGCWGRGLLASPWRPASLPHGKTRAMLSRQSARCSSPGGRGGRGAAAGASPGGGPGQSCPRGGAGVSPGTAVPAFRNLTAATSHSRTASPCSRQGRGGTEVFAFMEKPRLSQCGSFVKGSGARGAHRLGRFGFPRLPTAACF